MRFHRQVGAPARGLLVKEWLLPKEDLAVLVVENAPGKSAAPLGSSAQLQSRDPVIAIGHRAASDWVVTDGRVSNLAGREVFFSGDAVDAGKSGGPLLDANGRMVGLIGAMQGTLGEAISIDVIRPIIERWIGTQAAPAPSLTTVPATPPAVAATAPAPPPSASEARAPAPTPTPAQPPSVITGKDGAEMVLVSAGEFWMGSDKGDDDDEKPRHRVMLDGFYIDKYEVTNVLYQKFLSATGRQSPDSWSDSKFNGRQQPVVGVSWDDADAYCRVGGQAAADRGAVGEGRARGRRPHGIRGATSVANQEQRNNVTRGRHPRGRQLPGRGEPVRRAGHGRQCGGMGQ